jgi:MinD-like ATPase involved in chromosome partitioning or flagellar assembly
MEIEHDTLKVIIADTDLKTFEDLRELSNFYNVIFLSSDFAVNFILEYEKIDCVLTSNKISNLNSIIKKAEDKRIKLYIFGKDLKYPIDYKDVDELLRNEKEKKLNNIKNLNTTIKQKFKNMWREGKRLFEEKEESNKNIESNQNNIKLNTINKSINKNEQNGGITNKNNISAKLLKTDLKIEENYDVKNTLKIDPARNVIENRQAPRAKMKIIKQKIIVLAKAKGGVGSTTIGLFLSSILEKFSVLLMDLNFSEGGGDISYYLNIPRSPNILNFLNGYSKEALDNSIIQIKKNLHVLQPPPTFDQSKKIELQDIYCITDIAKKKYHILIIDLPNHLGDLWLGAIDLADLLILISDLSIGSIGRLTKINERHLYKGLEKLLVLNMNGNQNGHNLSDENIRSFFDMENYVAVEENKILRQKTDFSDLDFSNVPDFSKLRNKVLEIISN